MMPTKKITCQFARSRTQLQILPKIKQSYLPNQERPDNNNHIHIELLVRSDPPMVFGGAPADLSLKQA